ALLIDTGFGFGDIYGAVKKITNLPVIVVNTHGHIDHVQGNKFFDKVYIHKNDIGVLKLHSSLIAKIFLYSGNKKVLNTFEKGNKKQFFKRRINNHEIIKEGEILDIGGNQLEVIHTPGHTKGSICILDKKNRILYSGDTCSSHVWLFLKQSTNISTYINSIQKVIKRGSEFDIFLSSHSPAEFKTSMLEKIKHCADNISIEKSTSFDSNIAGKAFLYVEGFEKVTEQFGYKTFEEFMLHVSEIAPEDIAKTEFTSIAYSKKTLC
ncbi:MAG: MBL fold metallo-hydrolase, partial [Spirochaetales bacterium]|nr:MBL fold metallo-hydrolase [Spirochaetales bacterium]